jgi:hypothetical protein
MKTYTALIYVTALLAGCSAGVKVGSPASAVEPTGHTLNGGLISVNADVPWLKANATVGGTLPSVGLAKPTVKEVSNAPAKVGPAKLDPKALVAVNQPSDPCSATTPKDEPPVPDVEAVGYASITAQTADDLGQRRLLAARASRLDAYRNLVEQVYGLQVATDSAMINTHLGEDSFRARMEGNMCGATVVSIEPLGDDLYETRLRLSGAVAVQLRSHGKPASF